MVLGTPGSLFPLSLGTANKENSYVKIAVAEQAQGVSEMPALRYFYRKDHFVELTECHDGKDIEMDKKHAQNCLSMVMEKANPGELK